ncbi:MAG TPA: DUF4349 domain-containing protein [Anaerolineae bacterium]|nr:DUF4349 domain-containing protein [Anaerolineae bacterium]
MKKSIIATLALLVVVSSVACGAARSSTSSDSFLPEIGGVEMPQAEAPIEMAAFDRGEGYDTSPGFYAETPVERMVTRNANLTLVVTDPAQSVDEITQMAQDMEGYVVSSNVYVTTYGETETRAHSASITIRIPSEKLDDALEILEGDAVEVRNRNIYGQDITQEYIDNESRLRNLEAAEEQLLDIMEGATETEDVLDVFAELTRIRSEIEVIKGRLQYLEQSADTSSISIELIPDVATQPIEVERWQLEGTFNKAVEALIATAQFLVRSLIWIAIYILPLALIIGFVIWLTVFLIRRRRQAK